VFQPYYDAASATRPRIAPLSPAELPAPAALSWDRRDHMRQYAIDKLRRRSPVPNPTNVQDADGRSSKTIDARRPWLTD
jgi:hypothetical protein